MTNRLIDRFSIFVFSFSSFEFRNQLPRST